MLCQIANLKNIARGRNYRIAPTSENQIFVVSDADASLNICRFSRHNRSKNGIMNGVTAVAMQYNLHHIRNTQGGVFIDCGANIGELGLWASSTGMNYIAFEPEELEARCCDLNNYVGAENTYRIALWHKNTELTFFSKPDTADSSLIEMSAYNTKKTVQAKRLDHVLEGTRFGGTVILKVEAEGAEPEILMGAANIIDNVDYVALDCGYERGKQRDHTFIEANSILVAYGFTPVQANFRRLTVLYGRCIPRVKTAN